jgi:hypothetical protein
MINYYASDGKPYATAKESMEASQQLQSPALTVLSLINEAVFHIEGGNDAKSKTTT